MTAQDRAFAEGAALLDLGGREAVLEVRGRDAADFLQRMVSCDVRRCTATVAGGSARLGTLMTGKGKLVAPFLLLREHRAASGGPEGERFRIIVERSALDGLRAGLERLVILEEVEIAVAPLAVLSVQGPAADRALHGESAGGDPLPAPPLAWVPLQVGAAEPGIVLARARSPAGGFDLVVPEEARARIAARLIEGGALAVGDEAIERHRIAAGIPRFGVDATSENLPTECGYDDAIAYDKGCYAGQEVLARIRTYGHVNRRLCRLRIPGGGVPYGGAEIRELPAAPPDAAEPAAAIGSVTSAAPDPATEGAIALAFVRHRFAIAGTCVAIAGAGPGEIELVLGSPTSAP